MLRVLCSCGNRLGEVAADHLIISRKGRDIVVDRRAAVVSISCEDCGEVWRSGVPTPTPIARALVETTAIVPGRGDLPRAV